MMMLIKATSYDDMEQDNKKRNNKFKKKKGYSQLQGNGSIFYLQVCTYNLQVWYVQYTTLQVWHIQITGVLQQEKTRFKGR